MMGTVYRVYSSYHESSESGTTEYGTYSTLDGARARALEVWTANKYPEPTADATGSLYASMGWDSVGITVLPVELDQPTNSDRCGYT